VTGVQTCALPISVGRDIFNIEQAILKWFKSKNIYPILDKEMICKLLCGYTETVPADAISLQEIWSEVNKLAKELNITFTQNTNV